MYLTRASKISRIGFVSTRFKGTDGVSLETIKWQQVLERMGYECFFFSGLSDWAPAKSMVIEEAFFGHPQIDDIQKRCFGKTVRDEELSGEIQDVRYKLKTALYDFVITFKIDLLIMVSAFSVMSRSILNVITKSYIAVFSL